MKRRRPAFTILELLAVMAILTLLMGILIPSLSAARQQAKSNVCLSKLKGIGTSFALYTTENKDTYPPARLKKVPASSTEDYVNEYNRKHPRWQWFLVTGFGPPIDPKPFARLGVPFDDEGLGAATLSLASCPLALWLFGSCFSAPWKACFALSGSPLETNWSPTST